MSQCSRTSSTKISNDGAGHWDHVCRVLFFMLGFEVWFLNFVGVSAFISIEYARLLVYRGPVLDVSVRICILCCFVANVCQQLGLEGLSFSFTCISIGLGPDKSCQIMQM